MTVTPLTPNSDAGGRTTLVDHVDVTIEAYLGSAKLTVAELSALRAGASVTLASALNALVELRVNGVAIAEGELVAVGDNFGVRIVSVAP